MANMTEVKYRKMQLFASAYKVLKSERREGELQTIYAEARQWLEENVDELIREIQEVILSAVKKVAQEVGEEEPDFQHAKWVSRVTKVENVPPEMRELYQVTYKGLMRLYFYPVDLEEKINQVLDALAAFKQNYELLEDHLEKFGFSEVVMNGLVTHIRVPDGKNPIAFSMWAVNKARSLEVTQS